MVSGLPKQKGTSVHTGLHNVVTLVWGLLMLTLIIISCGYYLWVVFISLGVSCCAATI